tara:strand:+ start:2245 stop:2898 length:654 start_codon:yes stop_codon:yes gene_type:complete
MNKTYILKSIQPNLGVDDVDKLAQNLMKPGESCQVCERQQRYSGIVRKVNHPNLNVLAVAENPKTNTIDLEQLLHDKLGPYRYRIGNGFGGTTRELAKNVPLKDQILQVCLLAQGTIKEIDSGDAARFTPTQKAWEWAYKKIRQFDIAVVEEGFGWMPYGHKVGTSEQEWIDEPWEGSKGRPNNSKKAHEVAIKFNQKNMPVAFNFCKYKPKVFALG